MSRNDNPRPRQRLKTWAAAGLTVGLLSAVSCPGQEGAPMTTTETATASKAQADGLALDPGGFTVHFENARANAGTPVTGESLLRNGDMETADAAGSVSHWQSDSYVWLPVEDAACEARMHKRLRPQMSWAADADEAPHSGRRSARLATPRAAFDESDPAGHEFCAYFRQRVALPPLDSSVKLVLSYHHRGRCEAGVPNSRPYVRVSFYDSEDPVAASTTRTYAQTIFKPSRSWRRGELCFSAPKGTRRLDVRLALAGAGQAWFDDVALHRTTQQALGPTVRLMPWDYLDNLYCLPTGQAGVMVFGFRNEASAAIDSPRLLLQLPPDIEILDLDQSAKILSRTPAQVRGQQVREYRIDIAAWKNRIRDGAFRYPYNMWDGLALLLRTPQPPTDASRKGWYWLEDGEHRTKPRDFDIRVVPAVPAAPRPRLFRAGAHLFLMHKFVKPEGVAAFADLYQRVGFNAVHVPPSPLGAEFGRLGVERYTQPFANGYTIGDRGVGQKPDNAVFRLVDGSPRWEAICPVEVYQRGPYFRRRIENDTLRRILVAERQAEQIMANWEPFMYCGKGCFCDRCKDEFRTYGKLAAEELERVWPKSVIREHGELWIKFRAWQHGRLMATIEETVNAVGREAGLDSHFIPEIHHRLLTDDWEKHSRDREYAAVDYLGKLPVLEPWAPYNWYIFTRGPYDYVRGQHLSCLVTAREVQGFLAKRLPEGKRPRLIAFPYGTYEGATQPEAIVFEILTYFLERYRGAFVYLFPGGYDARYWRALTEANRLIARFEPFACAGKATKGHQVKAESPLPKPDPRGLPTAYGVAPTLAERWQDLSLLQSWEFESDGRRLIVVGNFWERGECFFRLTAHGPDPSQRYVLHEPAAGRCYAERSGRIALTAADLASGVLLHVGAMRHSFFVLEPHRDGADCGTPIRPQQMHAAMQERLPAIRKSSEEAH